MSTPLRPAIVAGLVVSLCWWGSRSVDAATPRIALIDGLTLPAAVVSVDWVVNSQILEGDARTEIDPADVADRSGLDVGLFWGSEWDSYVDSGQSLAALDLDRANQRARFLPAVGNDEALLVFGSIPGPGWPVRAMTDDGLAALLSLGVLVRIDGGNVAPNATPLTTTDR
jgi:hypothetical protein